MTEITALQVHAAVARAVARMAELRDLLNQLDAAMGDGDMGITVTKAAAGLREFLAAAPAAEDLGKFISGVGLAFNRAAPSTLGALTATALMRAGKEARGAAALDGPLLARMLCAADEGVQERGHSKPGDKTLLDALHPASEAFARAIAAGQDLAAAGAALLQAARAGRDAAIPLRSKIGRASWVGERTENQPDPGTVLVVQWFEAILGADYSAPGSTGGQPTRN
jgi:phosphoenolpyruvate---glycerone phosphotransferase subunit DhaL